jgi:hypothetical protein
VNLQAYIGRYGAHPRLGRLARPYLARTYRHGAAVRYAVLFEPNSISYAQIYPFVLHAKELERRYNIQIRFFSADRWETLDFSRFDKLLLQLWFTRDHAVFQSLFERAAAEAVEIVAFLDSFAHNDLRLASLVDSHIRFYLKKSLFRHYEEYARSRLGHTNLMDYYQKAFGIADERCQWDIPRGFQNKLRLSPNFFTAPHLYGLFLEQDIAALMARAREIDVHARFGQKGTPWYTAMRTQAMRAVAALDGVRVVCEGTVSPAQFNKELQSSKMCFSPFGYGELCWRDIEAMAYGAVLLKPDMSHLETLPDLYEANVTYVPLAWDGSDLQEKVDWMLANPTLASDIAREAFARIRRYLHTGQFVQDMEYLFTP